MKMNITRVLGLAAIAGLLAVAASVGGAQALSLSNPAASTAANQASGTLTTDVHWRRHRGWHRHHGWHRHRHWHRRHWY